MDIKKFKMGYLIFLIKQNGIIPVLSFLLLLSCSEESTVTGYTRYVNPMIGTGANGGVTPVSSVPFGMVQVGPDTRTGGSGYHYDDNTILGFSHFHKSGGGCSDYLDILFQPVPGTKWSNATKYPLDGFPYPFSHDNEKAIPGNYTVTFDNPNIRVSLTATARCAFHQYTFPETGENFVAIDLKHGATGGCTIVADDNYDTVRVSNIRVVDKYTIEGCRISVGQAKEAHAYFYAVFSEPFLQAVLYKNRQKLENTFFAEGTDIRSMLQFDLAANKELYVKVGVSTVSTEGARKNLEKEIPGWDFQQVKEQASEAWNRELSKIEIEADNPKQKKIFYTSLYFSKMYPMLWMDVDGSYRGADNNLHKAEGFNYYGGHMGFWDTYRASYPLLTITNPDVANDIVRTSLSWYDDCGQLPVLPVFGCESYQMTGLHVMQFIADCYTKGIRDYDAEKVFEAMKATSMRDTTGFSMRYFTGLKNYKRYGYIPADLEMEAVARTLDYAYNDWGVAQVAKMLGETGDYSYFIKRAGSYKNIFDKETGFMRGKVANGGWRIPFDPFASKHRKDDYCEGNAWQWTFSVPHDVRGFAKLMGGEEKMCERLDSLFTVSSEISGEGVSGDISGMIGQYAHGNEPSHHITYMYSYLGQPWKTQQYVHQVLKTLYDNAPEGICGNEDTGQMSAWYVFSAMGLYPARPGDGNYVVASPLFQKATINLPNEEKLIIKTNRLSDQDIYIQSVAFNGEHYPRVYFEHQDLFEGGEIVFNMGTKPNECWGTDKGDWPPSMLDERNKQTY